jgi:Holliday junction resolvase-like predicted endonuclease
MQAPTGELVIVEVKSRVRTSDASARSNAAAPELAMTDDKRRRLLDIKRDLSRRNPHERFRVDLVAVELDEQNNVLAMRHYPSIV